MSALQVLFVGALVALCLWGVWWAMQPADAERLPDGASCFGSWSEDELDLIFDFPERG